MIWGMGQSLRSIAVVTGSRAEFGLLQTVIRALKRNSGLTVDVIAGGEHDPAFGGTAKEVAHEFPSVRTTELDEVVAEIGALGIDAVASVAVATEIEMSFGVRLGVEVVRFATHLAELKPDLVLVLGDRIEAFAAAAAAAVSGIRLAHMHGGDRAEGIADESLRHAISKLAHLHLPATEQSANRLVAMGEEPSRVHVVGSPAIDDLATIPPLSDAEFTELGSPQIVMLLHPAGDAEATEHDRAARLIEACRRAGRTLVLHPNHDPGRAGIMHAIEESNLPSRGHLPRAKFIGLLRRANALVGNSSAGLIEAAALPCWCVNVGNRQSGRERAGNVIDVQNWNYQTIKAAIGRALNEPIAPVDHPYGDGRTGRRVADLLASIVLDGLPLHKRNTY